VSKGQQRKARESKRKRGTARYLKEERWTARESTLNTFQEPVRCLLSFLVMFGFRPPLQVSYAA
jgi:hypothetical protein